MSSLRYATFFERLTAVVLDLCCIFIVLGTVLFAFFGTEFFTAIQTPLLLKEKLNLSFDLFRLLDFLLPICAIILWIYFGGTPGKIILKLRIVDANTHKKLGLRAATFRYIGYIPSTLICGLGFFAMLFDEKNQCWHDKLGNSVVIREPRT